VVGIKVPNISLSVCERCTRFRGTQHIVGCVLVFCGVDPSSSKEPNDAFHLPQNCAFVLEHTVARPSGCSVRIVDRFLGFSVIEKMGAGHINPHAIVRILKGK